jgi:hypothetical protein
VSVAVVPLTVAEPIRNQPSPSSWMATSSALPVDWSAPDCMLLSIEPSWAPRPTCDGF